MAFSCSCYHRYLSFRQRRGRITKVDNGASKVPAVTSFRSNEVK